MIALHAFITFAIISAINACNAITLIMEAGFLRLTNFTKEKEYLKLQNYFLSFDYFYYNTNKKILLKVKEPLKITVQEDIYFDDDFEIKTTVEAEKYFLDDFIYQNVKNIWKLHLEDFKKISFEKSLFTPELKDGYYKVIENELVPIVEKIENASFLPKKLIKELIKQAKIIKDEIKGFTVYPYPKIYRKLEINTNRTDIEVFFHLLKENGLLKNATANDIGNVIDSSFKYKDESLGVNKHIIGAAKKISDLGSGKTYKKSLERLKKIFTSPDYYK